MFSEITPAVLADFELYLKKIPNGRDKTKQLHTNTIYKVMRIFRELINRAITVDKIMEAHKSPFLGYKLKMVKTEKTNLTNEEIESIAKLDLGKFK